MESAAGRGRGWPVFSALVSVATITAVLPHVCAEGGPPVAVTQSGLV